LKGKKIGAYGARIFKKSVGASEGLLRKMNMFTNLHDDEIKAFMAQVKADMGNSDFHTYTLL